MGKEIIRMSDAAASGAILGFDGKTRFLSNFASSPIEMYGILFPTIEHAFAAAKLNPNGGVHTRAEVLAEMKVIADTPKPNDAKRLGRRRIWNAKPFMRSDWDGIKNNLIRVLIRRKFEDPELRAKLLATGDVDLFELNTWGDDIWGVVEKNGDLLGDNMLGQLLMQVRAEIRADQSSSP